ncbi:MAG TPA: alpha-ketoglutarate-dependent dioxygenase AlkB, partial [Psychrobacter sp.]|nr:alpha-ketoglutarate-dependent dioxygenase AlkB [Psychrobacter sp.]
MDLFAPQPSDNLLPFDGIVNDLGFVLEDPQTLYQQLLDELPWQSDKVTLFGKTHITTRNIVWMGDTSADDSLAYRYSGHTREIIPWHPVVFHVK